MQSNEKRYVNLLFQILKKRPKKILEIGVYNGRRAIQMIEAAKIFNKNIEYYGFDLFEGLTKKIYNTEASKFPSTIDKIKELLNNRAKIFLYKGFTNETLKKFSLNGVNIDFIFIVSNRNLLNFFISITSFDFSTFKKRNFIFF